VAGVLARDGIDDVVALVEPVLLRREREPVRPRLPDLLGLERRVVLQLADRLVIVDELGGSALEPLEEPPPARLRLAAVVVEQLRRELLVLLEQRHADPLALLARPGRLLGRYAHLGRLAPGGLGRP